MKPFELLEQARTPDGTALTLHRHDGAYILRANGVELMSTRRSQSEVRLAERACAPLAERAGARVLIGGLGLGFTLREALRVLAGDARVVVVELVQEVIDWNRDSRYALAGTSLDDARVTVVRDDVANVLRRHQGEFDAIMLDVDNGADALTSAGNAQLYNQEGIRLAKRALASGGVLAYWSADADLRFERALRGAGLHVETERVRAHRTAGGYHTLYIGRLRPRDDGPIGPTGRAPR